MCICCVTKFPESNCLFNGKIKSVLAPYSNRCNVYSKWFTTIKRINNNYIVVNHFSCYSILSPFHRNISYFTTIKATSIFIRKSHSVKNITEFFCAFISNRNKSFCSTTKEKMIIISKYSKDRSCKEFRCRISFSSTKQRNYFKTIIQTRQIPNLVCIKDVG